MFLTPRELVLNVKPTCKTFSYYVRATLIFALRFSRVSFPQTPDDKFFPYTPGDESKYYSPRFTNSDMIDFVNEDKESKITFWDPVDFAQAPIFINHKLASGVALTVIWITGLIYKGLFVRRGELVETMDYRRETSHGVDSNIKYCLVDYPVTWKFRPRGGSVVEVVGFAVNLNALVKMLVRYSETERVEWTLGEFIC